jgi:hypothetical protein
MTGSISDLCVDAYTFIMDIVQHIAVNWLQGLTLHATIGINPACRVPYHQLLAVNSIVSFTGKLSAMEGRVASVIVGNIVYYPLPDTIPFQ